jgi:hypothetical protein
VYIIEILKYGLALWEEEDACDKLLRAGDDGIAACFIIIRADTFFKPKNEFTYKVKKKQITQYTKRQKYQQETNLRGYNSFAATNNNKKQKEKSKMKISFTFCVYIDIIFKPCSIISVI